MTATQNLVEVTLKEHDDVRHIIYKTSSPSGKFYIGRHSTRNLDDGYVGSGKWVRSIKNKSQLTVEILSEHENILEVMKAEELQIAASIDDPYNMNFTNKSIGFGTGDFNPARLETVKTSRSKRFKGISRGILPSSWRENIRAGHIGLVQSKETVQKRSIKNSKVWLVTDPKNNTFEVKNLRQFCKTYNLDQGNMSKVSTGKYKHHKGWMCSLSMENTHD